MNPKADAQLAGLVLATEDTYDCEGASALTPAVDVRLTAGYRLRGYLLGTDALLRRGAAMALADRRVFYGVLLASIAEPASFLCLIRGTAGWLEWIEDGEFTQVPHPRGGKIEAGFWGIYRSLNYRACGSTIDAPLAASITGIVGSGRLAIAGHSLGAALATYLAVDLADPQRLGKRVSLRAVASPRPGDSLFAQYAGAMLTDCRAYAREFDVVPRVPFGLSYESLPTTEIAHDAFGIRVRFDDWLRGNHHLTSYIAQMDPDSITNLPPKDEHYLACLVLPTAKAA